MPAYSASRKNANRSPPYSVYGPEHDLGVRDRHVERRPGELGQPGDEEHHRARQLPQQPPRLPRLDDPGAATASRPPSRPTPRPARTAARTPAAAPPCASRRAARTCSRSPSPAINVPTHADAHHRQHEEQAEVEVLADQARAERDRDQRDQVRDERDPGRQPEDRPVRGGRDDVLLLHELHAVGDELQPAVEAAGVHRADPRLHVRHHLVLGLADEQRQHQERGQTATRRIATSRTSLTVTASSRRPRVGRPVGMRGPGQVGSRDHAGRPGVLRRAAARPAVAGLAGLLCARPRLGRPGGEHEVLAQRVALERVRAAAAAPGAGGRRSRCRTSRRSRARARRPRGRRRSRSAGSASSRRHAACEQHVRHRPGVPTAARCGDDVEPVRRRGPRRRASRSSRSPARRAAP